jgi:transcriptional regulator with XRE-family HTH domain
MYEDFFYERLVRLRMNKNVSQREMSLSMGQSEGYMTKIESRVALPSMTVFFLHLRVLWHTPERFLRRQQKEPRPAARSAGRAEGFE